MTFAAEARWDLPAPSAGASLGGNGVAGVCAAGDCVDDACAADVCSEGGCETADCCCAIKGAGNDEITVMTTASTASKFRFVLKKGLLDEDAIILRPNSG